VPARERIELSGAELLRAARILAVRSRRESTGLFAGNYLSAFRGGGLEFEESRPYVPGDDVRAIDWNATARSGEVTVKTFREERDQTLLFALDVSASMRFASGGRTKAATAAHALALLASAAGRAGDATGLVAFDEAVRAEVPLARGPAHSWRVIRAAVEAAAAAGGRTRLAAGLGGLARRSRRRSVRFVLSDFRELEAPGAGAALAAAARAHDVVAAVIADPLDEALPDAGSLRLVDPERPGRPWLLGAGSRRARERYREAAAHWRRQLERELRRCGADLLWLRTDQSPLVALGRFFEERAARRRRGAA
jgi:uncharacterized protein (DUF58 family)